MPKRIAGNIVGLPSPRSDWNQTDEMKADFIKNKPAIGDLSKLNTFTKESIVDAINEINLDCDGRLRRCDQQYAETAERIDNLQNGVGDIETALDGIIAIQNGLLGVSE